MESFGEKLRSTRESLGYSIEQIARDTHIAKKYLIALESEDFSIFPGETYLKGFLQNYSEYLGLNIDEMIVIYKNMKIQEQPIPLDQLLDQKMTARRLPVILAIAGGVAVVAAVVLILAFANPFGAGGNGEGQESEKVKEFVYEGQRKTIDASKGFLIKVPVNNGLAVIAMQRITDDGCTLSYNNLTTDFIIGDEKLFDFDSDGKSDLAIVLNDISKQQNLKNAELTLKPPSAQGATDIASNASDLELIERGIAKVIREEAVPARFAVDVTVIKNCYLIYYLDSRTREEKFAYKGDTLSLSADRSADLRSSDGGSIKLKVAGSELEAGRANELFAGRFRWVKGGSDKYKLILVPVR